MEKKYAWAQNETKLARAIGELGPDASEEAVKTRYIEMAGLLLSDEGEKVAAVVLEDEEEAPAPKKGKDAKKK